MRRRAIACSLLVACLAAACGSPNATSLRLRPDDGQYYGARNTPDQVKVRDGVLELGADRTGAGLRSSEVRSPSFTYGTVRVRAKVSAGTGMWPAIWLVGKGPARRGAPEIDILEVPQRNSSARRVGHFTYHWTDANGVARMIGTAHVFARALSEGFHDYTLSWRPGEITWSVDGMQVMHVERAPERSSGTAYYFDSDGHQQVGRPTDIPVYSGPMYLRVTNGVGTASSWPGAPTAQTPFPNTFSVESIAVDTDKSAWRATRKSGFDVRR